MKVRGIGKLIRKLGTSPGKARTGKREERVNVTRYATRAARLTLVYVGGEMFGKVIRPCEAFAAHLAVVRPLPGVYTEMPGQVALPAERTAAEQADERPFTGVLAHVQLQILLGPDALTAKGAGEAALAPVHLVAAARQADHSIGGNLGPIVVHGVVIRVPDLARAPTTRRAPYPPCGHGLTHLHLQPGLPGILAVDARRLGHALLSRVLVERPLLARVGGGVAARLHLGRLPRAGHLVAPLGGGRHRRRRAALRLRGALQPFQRVVQPVLLERLEIPELHPADVAGEQLVGWEAGTMVLLPVLHVRGAVAVALAALLAGEGLVVARLAGVLEQRVPFQQPGGRKRGQTDAASTRQPRKASETAVTQDGTASAASPRAAFHQGAPTPRLQTEGQRHLKLSWSS